MHGLTARQNEILNFIKEYIKEHKYPPAVRDIAEHFGISSKASYDHLRALKRKQYIRSNSSRSRTIEILDRGDTKHESKALQIPILGNVAAGIPLFSEENYDGTVEVASTYVGSGDFFALHVKGDSMINAGILEGDIAVIRHQSVAENGEIVVAMVDDAYTIKRLYIEKNRIRLQPANSAYTAKYAKNVVILGKLVYLIRNYGK